MGLTKKRKENEKQDEKMRWEKENTHLWHERIPKKKETHELSKEKKKKMKINQKMKMKDEMKKKKTKRKKQKLTYPWRGTRRRGPKWKNQIKKQINTCYKLRITCYSRLLQIKCVTGCYAYNYIYLFFILLLFIFFKFLIINKNLEFSFQYTLLY